MALVADSSNPRGFVYALVAIVFLSLTWPVIFLRLAARYHIKSLGVDDALMVLAQLGLTTNSIAALAFHSATPGAFPATFELLVLGSQWIIVSAAAFCIGMVFLKLSLGAFFLRLIHKPPQRMLVYAAMTLSTITNIYVLFLGLFSCGNLTNFALKHLEKKCLPNRILVVSAFTQAGVNTATDLTFALVPFLLLRGSQLPKKVKMYVYSVLLLATAGCIASIVRFWFVEKIFTDPVAFYSQVPVQGMVGLVEVGTGIIAGSAPTLRPLLRSCLGYASSIYHGSSRTTGSKGTSNDVSKKQESHRPDNVPRNAQHSILMMTEFELSEESRRSSDEAYLVQDIERQHYEKRDVHLVQQVERPKPIANSIEP